MNISLLHCQGKFTPTHSHSRLYRSRSRRSISIISQSSAVNVDSTALVDWAASQGVDVSKIKINSTLVANRPIAKGETAISVSKTFSITKDTALQSNIGPFIDSLEPWLAISLFLLKEQSNPSSPWKSYIASLPTSIDSPVGWSDEELDLLTGTQLINTVQAYRSFFIQQYNELKSTLFDANPSLFPSDVFTYDAFLWAACTVRARSHPPLDGADVALVPLIDLVQHSRGSSINSSLTLKSSGLFGKDTLITIEAQHAIQPDDILSFDYGPDRTEGQIFIDYGTMDTRAPGSFALTVTLPDDDRFFDDKIDILEQSGYQESNQYILTSTSAPPISLLANLRLVNLQGSDAFLLEALFRNEVWDHLQLPISEQNEAAVYQSMIEGCNAALDGYSTTIDEDIAELKNAAPGSRKSMAVRVRLGEKEALESALRYFETKMGQLSELEYYGDRRLKRLGLLDKEGKPTDWDSFFEDGIA